MDLSLRAMRYLQAAARCGSIAAAAEQLHVAASAVATAIDQAEEAFGVQLVIRRRARGIQPTAAGRGVLRRVDDLLERYETMLAQGSELRNGLSGLLSIGYYAPMAPAFLPRLVAALRRDNPALTFAFEACDNDRAQTGLLEGRFDAILFVAENPPPQIGYRCLIEAPAYCLCAADHPFAARAAVTLDEVAAGPLVLLDRPIAAAYYRALLGSTGRPLEIVAHSNSTEMVRSLVGAGLGCALLNMRPDTALSYAGQALVALPIAGEVTSLALAVGHSPGPMRKAVQAFVDACEACFETAVGEALIVRPTELP